MTENNLPVVVIDNQSRDIDPSGNISNALLGPWTDIYAYASAEMALDDHPDAVHRDDLDQGSPITAPIIWPTKQFNPND